MGGVRRVTLMLVALGFLAGPVLADGMIVPVDPGLRVRGPWAVTYHHVKITVRDQVASVTIDQEFVNTGEGMIEVEYLFPVPPDAAIDAMTLTVDGKDFAAKLLPADEARKIYEDIVRQKKDPALLEYAGFGLYRTRAFPLEPGKPVKVIVHYTCVCKKDAGRVEVWYPLNTEKFSARPIDDVKVTVDIKEKVDIPAVYSPTHELSVERKGPRHVIATYHEKNVRPEIDFQVFYQTAEGDVGATLLSYWPDAQADGYFLLLLSPNPQIGGEKVIAKDVVVVLDRSGSMSGEKIDQAKEALGFILNNLNADDRFTIIAYNDRVDPLFDGLVEVNQENLAQARDRLDRIEARGGTNIHEALQTAMKLWPVPGRPLAGPKYVIFLTDGLPTVGKTDMKTILADTAEANISDARLFVFGVGYNVNVHLLDKLAQQNAGRSDYAKPAEPIEAKISSLYTKIKNPVMTNLAVRVEGVAIGDIYPAQIGDLFEGDQIVLAGRYNREDAIRLSGGRNGAATLVVTGVYQGLERAFEYPVGFAGLGEDPTYQFVEQLWAVRRMGHLMEQIDLNGESKELIDELVSLSMKYGIITPYTSSLADETTRLWEGEELGRRVSASAAPFKDYSGANAQIAASNRAKMARSVRAPMSSSGGVRQLGHADQVSYEADEVRVISNTRQIGNQGIYRRGDVWVASSAAKIDLKRDAEKIHKVSRFSKRYFRLITENTVAENRILASQQPTEQLLIQLRGQVYLID